MSSKLWNTKTRRYGNKRFAGRGKYDYAAMVVLKNERIVLR
jgi:hypothetical protein